MIDQKPLKIVDGVNRYSVDKGDFQRIATIFNRRNHYLKTVTRSYVRSIVLGSRKLNTDSAKELKLIADRYFENKEAFEKEILS